MNCIGSKTVRTVRGCIVYTIITQSFFTDRIIGQRTICKFPYQAGVTCIGSSGSVVGYTGGSVNSRVTGKIVTAATGRCPGDISGCGVQEFNPGNFFCLRGDICYNRCITGIIYITIYRFSTNVLHQLIPGSTAIIRYI